MNNITLSRDTVEQWLEDLEYSDSDKNVIAAIKQALAAQHEPENEPHVSLASVQEPVAYRSLLASGSYTYCNTPQFFDNAQALYATPPAAHDLQAELDATNRQVEILSDALADSQRQRQWVGLTDAEKQWIRITEWTVDELIEWVNTKLKEKNT